MLAVMSWFAAIAILCVGARHHGRQRDMGGLWLVAGVAGVFFLSIVLAFMPPPRWYLAAPEFLCLALAVRIWHDYGQEKARVVALLSMGKLTLRWAWYSGLPIDHAAYAAALNAAFLFQCLVAGGLLDGIGVAIADRARAATRGRAGNRHAGAA